MKAKRIDKPTGHQHKVVSRPELGSHVRLSGTTTDDGAPMPAAKPIGESLADDVVNPTAALAVYGDVSGFGS